jgi:hypothetical protein
MMASEGDTYAFAGLPLRMARDVSNPCSVLGAVERVGRHKTHLSFESLPARNLFSII